MKRRILMTGLLLIAAVAASIVMSGCRSTDCGLCYIELSAPSGVFTVTGDGYVEIFWDPIPSSDVYGYQVYRSLNAEGPYTAIGRSGDADYVDDNVSNGITYYYAVTAYDRHDHESDLSYETIHDTPRPEGTGLVVYDLDELAGVDFSGYYDDMVLPWDDPYADMFLYWDGQDYAMASTDVIVGEYVYGTDIQTAGYVSSLDELDWAPEGGWTTEHADSVVLLPGYAYWVWTWENHFAKFRVHTVGDDFVVLDWAFQTDEGNPELVMIPGNVPTYHGKHARNGGALANSRPEPRVRGSRFTQGSR